MQESINIRSLTSNITPESEGTGWMLIPIVLMKTMEKNFELFEWNTSTLEFQAQACES